MKAAEILKKILDLLPFNGSKLKLGGIFSIIAIIQQFFPAADFWELLKLILSTDLSKTAIITVLVAFIHKKLKQMFPDAVVRDVVGKEVQIQGENVKVAKP